MFLHRLALALGRTTRELELTMGSAELSEWFEYHAIEPWGAQRDNYHSAQIAALLYNINRGKQKPVTSQDFMFMDPETAQELKDREAVSFLSSLSQKG